MFELMGRWFTLQLNRTTEVLIALKTKNVRVSQVDG
jgi:hypothetical protein